MDLNYYITKLQKSKGKIKKKFLFFQKKSIIYDREIVEKRKEQYGYKFEINP